MDWIEIYNESSTFIGSCKNSYEVVTTVEIAFFYKWYKRLINFLIRPFSINLLDDIKGLYRITVSKPKTVYKYLDDVSLTNFRKRQYNIAEDWINSATATEVLKKEKYKFKYKKLLW